MPDGIVGARGQSVRLAAFTDAHQAAFDRRTKNELECVADSRSRASRS